MQEKPDLHSYLRNVLRRTGWTQTELAKRAGIDPSTLSRFLSRESREHALRPSTISRIEQVSGLRFSDSETASQKTSDSTGFGESEAAPFSVASNDEVQTLTNLLQSRGAKVDPWILKSRSLELAGYLPGDILFVRLDTHPLSGDTVCAQVYDWANNRAETIFRVFQPPYLVAATTDMKRMQPLEVDGGKVVIKGTVTASLRLRR
jgi:transcriptional regulator with XRE-family HTH domain